MHFHTITFFKHFIPKHYLTNQNHRKLKLASIGNQIAIFYFKFSLIEFLFNQKLKKIASDSFMTLLVDGSNLLWPSEFSKLR
jgi:hypothetical protein